MTISVTLSVSLMYTYVCVCVCTEQSRVVTDKKKCSSVATKSKHHIWPSSESVSNKVCRGCS